MSQSQLLPETPIFIPASTDAAFDLVVPEIAALPDEETLPVNIDVVTAATIVLGRVPALNSLRPQLAEQLPRFDLARFDQLEQYALALIHAHGLHRGAQPQRAQVVQLGNDLVALRDRLYGNAVSLAENGLIDGVRLKDCKKATGYRATAADVFTLVPLFKEYWPSIAGKTPITPALLHEATNRAAQLLTAFGLREAPEAVGEKSQLRAKAFTVFMRAYDDARDAVIYLRREEQDADDFAPSLRGGAGRSRRRADDEQMQPTASATAKGASNEPAVLTVDNPEGLPLDAPYTN